MKFHRRILATVMLAGALATAGLAPATADEEPEPTTITVSGALVPTDEFQPYDVGLCAAECFNGLSINPFRYAEVDPDGAFTFEDVEQGSTYKIGVLYFTYKYLRDGSKKQVRAKGYLLAQDDRLVFTPEFDTADTWAIEGDLGTLNVFVPAPKKPKEPKPQVTARFEPLGAGMVGDLIRFNYKASKVQKGTAIVLKVYGCGGKVVKKQVFRGKTGSFDFSSLTYMSKLKRMAPVKVIATKKGLRSYTLQLDWGPIPNRPKSC